MVDRLEAAFPGLIQTEYEVTSPSDNSYNCIAWSHNDTERWWWPDSLGIYYWPPEISREERLTSFQESFESVGFVECEGHSFEEGYEKVAIFADSSGTPTHAARQVPGGKWTSKLGTWEDIEHALDALEGAGYGTIATVMKRAQSS